MKANFLVSLFVVLSINLFIYPIQFAGSHAQSDQVIYALEGEPTGLNPQITNSLTSEKLSHLVFDRLVEFGEGARDIKSGLAYLPGESNLPRHTTPSTVSSDGTVYELELRRGVRFHSAKFGAERFDPSREFQAEDVIFTFKRFMDNAHPLHQTKTNPNGVYPYWNSLKLDSLIKDVVAVNPYRVRLTLNRPHQSILLVLAIPLLSIHSKEYGDYVIQNLKEPELFDLHPVGTGPYQFIEWAKSHLKYKAFKLYFKGSPHFKSVFIRIEKSPTARSKLIAEGSVDIVSDPSVTDFSKMKKDPNYRDTIEFLQKPAMNLSFLAVNNSRIKKKQIRLGISLALNRQRYVREIFHDQALPAVSVLYPELNQSFSSDNYSYNPSVAKSIVNSLGTDDRKINLLYMPISRPYNPNGEALARLMQQDLMSVGFQVTINTVSESDGGWTAYLKKLSDGDFDVAQIGLNSVLPLAYDLYSIASLSAMVPGGNNWLNWSLPEFELVLNQIREGSPEKYQSLINQAEAILAEHMPLIPVLHSHIFRMVSNRIKGYQLHPMHHEKFEVLSSNY